MTTVESVEPFYTEPKLPLDVTSSDGIQLPVGVVNSTPDPLSNGSLSLKAEGLANLETRRFELAPDGRERLLLPLKIGDTPGETEVVLSAKAGPYADEVTRKLKVQPLGFPVETAQAGTLDGDDKKQHKITIPQSIVEGGLTTRIAVYPTPIEFQSQPRPAKLSAVLDANATRIDFDPFRFEFRFGKQARPRRSGRVVGRPFNA